MAVSIYMLGVLTVVLVELTKRPQVTLLPTQQYLLYDIAIRFTAY